MGQIWVELVDRVWAQPISDPTWLGGAVTNPPLTDRLVGLGRLDLQRMVDRSVGVIIMRKWRENSEISPNSTKISSNSMRF